jgi:hypothetical protein
MDEQAIKLGARLVAMEFAICELFSAFYQHMPAAQIHARHDQWIEFLRQRGVPGVDAAMSDLMAAETETALRELLGLIELHAQKPRAQRGA